MEGRKFGWLTSFEDGLDNIGGEKSEPYGPSYIFAVGLMAFRDFPDRSKLAQFKLLKPSPSLSNRLAQFGIGSRRPLVPVRYDDLFLNATLSQFNRYFDCDDMLRTGAQSSVIELLEEPSCDEVNADTIQRLRVSRSGRRDRRKINDETRINVVEIYPFCVYRPVHTRRAVATKEAVTLPAEAALHGDIA